MVSYFVNRGSNNPIAKLNSNSSAVTLSSAWLSRGKDWTAVKELLGTIFCTTKLLAKVAKEKGYANLVTFSDDGISGVTMERPGFKEMIQELEKGHAAAVFVKDMSRLERSYIEVGRLTEEFFPEHNIRLVAVSDNLDTDEGESEQTPIKNLFNE